MPDLNGVKEEVPDLPAHTKAVRLLIPTLSGKASQVSLSASWQSVHAQAPADRRLCQDLHQGRLAGAVQLWLGHCCQLPVRKYTSKGQRGRPCPWCPRRPRCGDNETMPMACISSASPCQAGRGWRHVCIGLLCET